MAFTLGFHIVLACLGVALPATILVANYLGLKRGDKDAMELARRWSKAMAVTFAVGAVTGTVLSFEFGLLWPEFMDRWGSVFGVAFAIEGIFFFIEAIFLGDLHLRLEAAQRLGPLLVRGADGDHRDRRRRLGGRRQRLDEPAAGLHPERRRRGDRHRPARQVLFNPAIGYEVPHMILAAYMVTGFLVASIYAVGMLKGRRDRLHRLGLLIPLTIACIATPIQLFVGDTAAREVADHQPAKFAGMECIYETGPNQTEWIGGICTDDGVKLGIGIPDLDSFLVGWSADTVVTGLNDIPADERPPANTLLHLSFDAMVGIGTALMLLAIWLALGLVETARHPADAVVPARGLGLRRGRDRRALVRLDRHRGRPPALDRPGLHADRGSGDRGGAGSGSPSAPCCCSTRRSARSRSSSCAGCRAAGASRRAETDDRRPLRAPGGGPIRLMGRKYAYMEGNRPINMVVAL